MIVQVSASAIGLTIFGFCLSRIAGGIIGEYGKRAWFRYVEPVATKLVARWKAIWFRSMLSKAALQQNLEATRAELDDVRKLATRVCQENDALLLENIRLKVKGSAWPEHTTPATRKAPVNV